MNMQVRLNDPKTLQAITILAEVLDGISGPERLECLMAANALRQVAETRSETALNFARQAFDSLDAPVRNRIQNDATSLAVSLIRQTRKVQAGKLVQPAPPKPTGSPILDAINKGGMGTERKW